MGAVLYPEPLSNFWRVTGDLANKYLEWDKSFCDKNIIKIISYATVIFPVIALIFSYVLHAKSMHVFTKLDKLASRSVLDYNSLSHEDRSNLSSNLKEAIWLCNNVARFQLSYIDQYFVLTHVRKAIGQSFNEFEAAVNKNEVEANWLKNFDKIDKDVRAAAIVLVALQVKMDTSSYSKILELFFSTDMDINKKDLFNQLACHGIVPSPQVLAKVNYDGTSIVKSLASKGEYINLAKKCIQEYALSIDQCYEVAEERVKKLKATLYSIDSLVKYGEVASWKLTQVMSRAICMLLVDKLQEIRVHVHG